MGPDVRSGSAARGWRVPAVSGGIVFRGGLSERLGAAGRVTVVSAPAGSGKTVLVRSWIGAAGLAGRAGWVSVPLGERDEQRFWLSALVEGSIDPDRGLLAMRYYVCTADYLSGIEARANQLPEARLAAEADSHLKRAMH
jgi:hypothetical protein